ncbi:MAG: MotA/TolQ/ExbB proton channel family protein [Myxococcales bacterium]|nr:MotA/TolQ/ExbB proton channel family protein [Myxococcales bacterium]
MKRNIRRTFGILFTLALTALVLAAAPSAWAQAAPAAAPAPAATPATEITPIVPPAGGLPASAMALPERGGVEQELIAVSNSGARVLLYVLFGLSILSIAVALEKFIQYRRDNTLGADFRGKLVGWLDAGKTADALKEVEGKRGVNAALIREGLQNYTENAETIEEIINSRLILERGRLERRLMILGTIGNNAPFIGLLGTVMGIIKAFHDLAQATTQGPQLVMAGISEALIATAVGLFVAIPAVIIFNALKGRVRILLDEAESNAKIVLAYAKRGRGDANGRQ